MARDKSLESLNPEFRAKVKNMMASLAGSPMNWQVFETWRPPATTYKKSSVSKSNPLTNPSKHGYGWAVDVVPNGTWKGAPKNGPAGTTPWDELRKAAHAAGLDNDIKWDRPHVEESRREMVKALQRKLGIKADGVWGSGTTKAAKSRAKQLGIMWRTPVPTGATKVHPTTYRELYASKTLGGTNENATDTGMMVAAAVVVAGVVYYYYKKG
jgi:hypothetical protein